MHFRKKQIQKVANQLKRFSWKYLYRALLMTEVMSNPIQPLLSMKHLPNAEEFYKAYEIEHNNMPHDVYLSMNRNAYSLVSLYLQTKLVKIFKNHFQVSYDPIEKEMKVHWCGHIHMRYKEEED